jgi:hypothetical protein
LLWRGNAVGGGNRCGEAETTYMRVCEQQQQCNSSRGQCLSSSENSGMGSGLSEGRVVLAGAGAGVRAGRSWAHDVYSGRGITPRHDVSEEGEGCAISTLARGGWCSRGRVLRWGWAGLGWAG